MYSAICLSNDEFDKDGFLTIKDAEDFIVNNYCCSMCKEDGMNSACACEWLVVETEKLEGCEKLEDLFEAAGWEKVKMDVDKVEVSGYNDCSTSEKSSVENDFDSESSGKSN